MKVLVTGRNGFLAKEISEHLSDLDLTFVGRQDLDLTDLSAVSDFFIDKKFDAILHTAIKGGRRGESDTFQDFTDNISMFNNLLANRDKFDKLINFCSGASFGRSGDIFEFQENRIYSWLPGAGDYYGMSKNLIARECNKTQGFYNLRIFGCFGINENDKRFVKSAITNSLNGEPITLHKNKQMDFVSAVDICTIVRAYLDNDYGNDLEDINICYEKKETLNSIAGKIKYLTNSSSDIIIEDNNIGMAYTGNASKLSKLGLNLQGLDVGLYNLMEKINEQT